MRCAGEAGAAAWVDEGGAAVARTAVLGAAGVGRPGVGNPVTMRIVLPARAARLHPGRVSRRHPTRGHDRGVTEVGAYTIDTGEARELVASANRWWWIFLVTGSAWVLFSVILLRFDYTSVAAVSILLGCAMAAAACVELIATSTSHGWGRAGHALLAVATGAIAVVAFIHPGNTFRALAAVLSFYLVIKGAVTIALALAGGRRVDLWWLTLLTGIVELVLGLWAAGYWGRSTALLLAWIGVVAMLRGVGDIVFAFRLRGASV